MQIIFFSIDNTRKKIKNKSNIKINKFDFKQLKQSSTTLCKGIQKSFLKEKIYLFEKIHQDFLKSCRDNLSKFIGDDNINITILESTLDVYRNYILKLKSPITFNMIELLENQDHAIIILSVDLVSVIIENLFGGDNFFICKSALKKNFTKIELGVIKKITNIIILSYNEIFQNVFLASMKYIISENILEHQKNTVSFNNDIFFFTVFKINFDRINYGIFKICIPTTLINKLEINSVYLSNNKYVNRIKENNKKFLENNIYYCNMILNVKLLDIMVNLSCVIKLKKGDILPIAKPEQALIYIDDFPIFKGIYNTVNKKNAICIKSVIHFIEETTVSMHNISDNKENILEKNKIDYPTSSKKESYVNNLQCENEKQVLQSNNKSGMLKDISHIFNVPVKITVKLGQIKIKIKDLLEISEGTILVLDKTIGDPLEIFINQSLIAKGEMVMVENQYGMRITTVIDTSKCTNNFNL